MLCVGADVDLVIVAKVFVQSAVVILDFQKMRLRDTPTLKIFSNDEICH